MKELTPKEKLQLTHKQQYNATVRFINQKLIKCDGTLSQKEITNLLTSLNFMVTHNNAIEREMRDLEFELSELKTQIKNTLNNLSNDINI